MPTDEPICMPRSEAAQSVVKLAKRAVAMHCGYVGTGYKGSMINRPLGEVSTIEAVLETALFKVGCISEANYGNFSKVNWSRASRTDKGVHSLGTVMALRMEVDETTFDRQPEGIELLTAINKNLPPTIQIFSMQRVNKKFNARIMCQNRVYEYYLPARMLQLKLDGSKQDTDRVELFRQALKVYEGRKAFHNFTKRKLYTENKPVPAKLQAAHDRVDEQAITSTKTTTDGNPTAPTGQQVSLPSKDGNIDDNTAQAGEQGGMPSTNGNSNNTTAQAGEQGSELKMDHNGSNGTAHGASQSSGAATHISGASGAGHMLSLPGVSPGGAAGHEATLQTAGEPPQSAGTSNGSATAGKQQQQSLELLSTAQQQVEQEQQQPQQQQEQATQQKQVKQQQDKQQQQPTKRQKRQQQSEGQPGDDGEGGSSADEADEPIASQTSWIFRYELEWRREIDIKDLVTQSHFRDISYFTADDPQPLVSGGTSCLRLEVCGNSFMLHQIRHMIGGAIAVACGTIPLQLLEAALCVPARISIPCAPPHTLMLSDCSFYPFPTHTDGTGESAVSCWSGASLALRQRGKEAKQKFRLDVLQPELEAAVQLPDWDAWLDRLPQLYCFKDAEVVGVLEAARKWMEERDRTQAQRAKAKQEWVQSKQKGERKGGAQPDAKRQRRKDTPW